MPAALTERPDFWSWNTPAYAFRATGRCQEKNLDMNFGAVCRERPTGCEMDCCSLSKPGFCVMRNRVFQQLERQFVIAFSLYQARQFSYLCRASKNAILVWYYCVFFNKADHTKERDPRVIL